MAKGIVRFLAEWLGLTVVSLLLFWLLWYIIGQYDIGQEESFGEVFAFDIIYCAVLSLGVMAVCTGFVKLLSRWMERRWAFLFASVGSLVANILLAHLLEVSIDCLYEIYGNDPEQFEGIYICGIIATMISILLLSNEHYRLYIEEQKERRRNEMAVLKQRLDIEELQRVLDDFRAKEAEAKEEQAKKAESPMLDVQSLLSQLGIAQKTYRTRFLVSVFDGVAVLETRDISHITIEGDKVMAYLDNDEKMKLEESSLDIMESLLDPADFFRANRQYIVSIRAIARLSNFFNQTKMLHLRAYPELGIKISKEKYSQLRERING